MLRNGAASHVLEPFESTGADTRSWAPGATHVVELAGDEPWLVGIERVLLSSEPFSFEARHVAAAQTLCPHALVQRVDGELLSWYGARAVAGLAYLRALADDNRSFETA